MREPIFCIFILKVRLFLVVFILLAKAHEVEIYEAKLSIEYFSKPKKTAIQKFYI